MRTVLAWSWMGLILASIFWYAFLLFYVGIKGGAEIISLGRNLSRRPESKDAPTQSDP